VNPGDLDDVVAFLPKRQRNGPAAVGGDVQDNDPKAKVLNLGDNLGDVLVSTGDEGIADRTALREGHQVPAELTFDPFTPARQCIDESQLQARHLSQRVVLGGPLPLRCGLVPVAAQHGKSGAVPGQASQQLQQTCVIP
jgi:hypothetical protein